MKALNKKELTEICFSLLHLDVPTQKTALRAFMSGRRKLLKQLADLESKTK